MILYLYLMAFQWSTSPTGVATYIQETKLDGSYYEYRDGETLLYFTSDESIYIHTKVPEKSRFEEGEGMTFKVVKGDPDGFPIYKNVKEGQYYIKASMPGGKGAVVLDTIPRIDWQIGQETRTIGKYTCKKAIGIYGGRVYEAWFTPEIPVPHGPYKLGGLPGLILEAHSQDGKVSFHFKSFEWTDKPDRAIAPPSVEFIFQSWDEQRKKSFEISEKIFLKMKANSPDGGTSTLTTGGPRVKGDFGIEKTNTPK